MLRKQDKKFLIEKSSNFNKRKKSHKRQKDIQQKETAKSNTKENKYIFFKKKIATKTQQIKSVFISLRKVNSTFYTYF